MFIIIMSLQTEAYHGFCCLKEEKEEEEGEEIPVLIAETKMRGCTQRLPGSYPEWGVLFSQT